LVFVFVFSTILESRLLTFVAQYNIGVPSLEETIDHSLNIALGFSIASTGTMYETIVCKDRGHDFTIPLLSEIPYVRVENEIQLEKQRFEQLHKDRLSVTANKLAESDRMIQANADKISRKTPQMEESDSRIQRIPVVIQGLPPRRGGNFTA
jgi:hypothetical protein